MITGELKSKVDRVWDAFWSGGISNPLEVIEQITYLLFIRRLDDLHTAAENRARRTGQPVISPVFQPGQDDLRWSRLKDLEPGVMHRTVAERVFPFLRGLGADGSTYSEHMKDARFTIPTPALLSRVVDMLDDIPMQDQDTKGDLYEYMLSKIATAGTNGQFRTPRHIIKLMVEMTAPQPTDEICDPASGTCDFLVAAAEYLREHHPEMQTDTKKWKHFNHSMFHGYDFDSTMLRIGSMNMLLHGVEQPDIRYRDSLSEGAAGEEGLFSLVLANPPFAGSLDYESTSKDLQRVVKTKKTELLFLALFLRLLKPGGRAAVIVPDGVLFGSSKAHKDLRRILVEDQKLDAVVKLPSGVFRPYAGVSTAILLFTKTNSGGTDRVWFYDARADGFSLDDKRNPVEANDLPDVLSRWQHRDREKDRARTEPSFLVPKADIVAQGYDLSLNRYKEVLHDETEHRAPLEIIADIEALEDEIAKGLAELKAMLSSLPMVPFSAAVEDESRGNPKLPQSSFKHEGRFPVVDQGQRPVAGYTDDETLLCRLPPPVLVFGDHTRSFKYVDHPFVIGADGVKVLRVREGWDPKYVYHYFASRNIPSAGYSRHFKFLKELVVPRPEHEEQRRIAAILDQADAVRATRRQILAHLEALTRSAFRAAFADVTEASRLGDLVTTTSGGTPNRSVLSNYGGGIPWVKSGELHAGLITETEETISAEGLASSSAKVFPAGTVLLAMYGATAGVVGRLGVDAATNQAICAIFPGPSLDPEYLIAALRAQTAQLVAKAAGGAQPNLSQGIIRDILIPVPSLEDQQRFSSQAGAIEAQRLTVVRAQASDDELFASLQSRAFRGEL